MKGKAPELLEEFLHDLLVGKGVLNSPEETLTSREQKDKFDFITALKSRTSVHFPKHFLKTQTTEQEVFLVH